MPLTVVAVITLLMLQLQSMRRTLMALLTAPLGLIGVALLFATDMHYLVIQALSDSYKIFTPGQLLPAGDIAALVATLARRDHA